MDDNGTSPAGRLAGKVAIVTGAARGIGRATAQRFRGEGAFVASWDLQAPDPLDTGSGPEGIQEAIDVRDAEAVTAAVAHLAATTGRIDILVNNAGITRGYVPLEKIDGAILDGILEVNLRGAVIAVQAVIGVMKKQRAGRILNISSVLATYGFPGQTAYVASKSALEGLTRVWAREFGPYGITVNTLRPGYVRTAMNAGNGEALEKQVLARTPLGRLGEVEDVASAFLWLASDEAAFVTGAILPVDGGFIP
jgi:3-oxoacyl-[acyl-carrier protein] reductase